VSVVREIRHATRRLARRPGFAVVAIVTLALGIGANTAVFSLVQNVLLEPLPYANPERLVMFWQRGAESDVTWLSARELVEYRRATRTFSGISAYTDIAANLTDGDQPERVVGAQVTPDLFETLGVPAARGRTLTAGAANEDDAVVIGWNLWQRRWGGAPDVINATVRVNGTTRRIIGVMPPDFRLPLDYREERATELWIPARIDAGAELPWGDRSWYIVARLAPGVSGARADADVDAAMQGWCEAGLLDNECERATAARDAVPLDELVTGRLRPALLLLFGAVGLVLLLACANVANLLLAHGDARRREIAIRAALGAGHRQLVRQLFIESGVIAAVGALLGVALAWGGLRALLAVTPIALIRARGVALDPMVLAFTLVLAVAATVLAGLVPALQLARPDLRSLPGTRGDVAPIRRGMRRALVTVQTAIAVVLVIGAALLARSFVAVRATDLGYETDHRLTLRLALPAASYREPESVAGFYAQLLDRIGQLPGVRSAAAARILPLTETIGDWSITIEGQPRNERENPNGDWQVVTPAYFETMHMALVAGRYPTSADRAGSEPVVLVNQTMAKRYWPGGALGQRFHLGTANQPWLTIIGVTRDVRHNAVIEEPRAEMYLIHSQYASHIGAPSRGMTVVVRTVGVPEGVLPAVRQQIRALDPSLPLSDIRTMDQVARNALAPQRFSAQLFGLFAAIALVLAAVGMYGVVSYIASRRTHEMGLRMALGATRAAVAGLVLREGAVTAGAGIVAGVSAGLLLTRLLASQLYGVSTVDPLTFTIVPAALVVVALMAAYLPARRAASVSPAVAMRE
jgi:predicted permease